MNKKLLAGLAVGIFLLGPVAAHATLKTYNDRSLFNLEVGSTTLIEFEAQQSNPSTYTYYGGNLTVGDVSFTSGDAKLNVLSPNALSTSGTSNYLNYFFTTKPVVINFASNVSAVGMDLGWLGAFTGSGSTMNIVLNNDELFTTYNVSGPLAYTNKPLGFVGFSSDKPFSKITINDPSGTAMIDHFAYTTKSSAPTPEPASMMLLGTGFAALAGARKLKKQKAEKQQTA